MISKFLFLAIFVSFSFAATSADVIDSKDKAEVKKIEQKIIQEKEKEAQKELEAQKALELAEQKARELDMQNLAQINLLKNKITNIETELKDNILLKRYSNYVSYGKISTELATLQESLKRKKM